jgi:cephalosporin-C deacetylase-like acetyl esterase
MKRKVTSLLLCLFIVFYALSQTKTSIEITPNHSDWTYKVGEPVLFNVSLKGVSGESYSIQYQLGPEKMPFTKSDFFITDKTDFVIEGGTMNTPGFLRCQVSFMENKKRFTSTVTAAFDPEEINPTVKNPSDFNTFWKKTISKAREIPLDKQFTELKDKSTAQYTVYQVSYQNHDYKNRSYAILTIPKKEGRFPAVIRLPGAGVHPLGGNLKMAEKDIITLDVYIHPFPMTWERSFYDSLKNSPYIDYKFWGVNNRETHYYKRVITGCVKAVDVIYSLPQFDGENLAAWGSSQGGALSIITTSLDKRIKWLAVLCPAMCDYTGYLYNRAGGWPHYFDKDNIEIYNKKEILKTLSYYDVVNFARMISVPGFYSWGFNDAATPPTSFYAAYNVIKAPKKVFVIPEGFHKIYTEQLEKTNSWILQMFQENRK